MKLVVEIDRRLEGYSVYEALISMRDLYAEIDAASAEWAGRSGAACPRGCGACCEAFELDFLPLEALFLAAWLAGSPTPAPDLGRAPPGRCPFYAASATGGCTVYPARGLVCRLFGFSGSRDKAGAMRYNPCKWMPPFEGRAVMPPSMEDFSRRAIALDPHGSGSRLPLREALPPAIARIQLILRNDGESDPEPEPQAA